MNFQIDSGSKTYGVKLEIFQGPLDLLLFLIQKDEIDIYDIPVAEITKQFLEYVEVMQALDLEQAGDFVLMAATLMKIKSRMLLPSDPDDEESLEDPREELIRRLLEYRQFKEVANWMGEAQDSWRNAYYRGSSLMQEEPEPVSEEASYEAYRSVSLFDLLKAYKLALDTAPTESTHDVRGVDVTTEERAQVVLEALADAGRVAFSDLISGIPRIVMIVTFIAILELIKAGKIRVLQAAQEGDIWVYGQEGTPV